MGANAGKLKAALGGSEADIKAAFDSYDKDKSGALEGGEAVKFVKDVQKILSKSKDPDVAKQAEAASPEEWVKKFADSSGDGKLQYVEFKHWAEHVGTANDKLEKKKDDKHKDEKKDKDHKDDKHKDDKHKDDKHKDEKKDKDHKDDKHKDDKHKDEKKDKDEKKEKKDKDEKKEKKDKK